mgnify:CR=1 FL=1
MNSSEYVNDMFNLSGHVGIVTGASRGLGMGVAKVLTDAGAKVYNLDMNSRGNDEEIYKHFCICDWRQPAIKELCWSAAKANREFPQIFFVKLIMGP